MWLFFELPEEKNNVSFNVFMQQKIHAKDFRLLFFFFHATFLNLLTVIFVEKERQFDMLRGKKYTDDDNTKE